MHWQAKSNRNRQSNGWLEDKRGIFCRCLMTQWKGTPIKVNCLKAIIRRNQTLRYMQTVYGS